MNRGDPGQAGTVEAYLDGLPSERRAALSAVRDVIRANLQQGYEECLQYGMISYVVPLARYPDTYNSQPLGLAALASQKHYMSLYLMNIYGDEGLQEWFREAWGASGKKLAMGKSCIRFKRLGDLPLDVIGQAVARTPVEEFISRYEETRAGRRSRK